ncbi:patellin-3-like [Andrographis paniculata]|uniref:patellin-3-like n=1 Tax=Andrographis paniculata TaxID=175694 RepID=UPI0021E7F314|nr:patellin-3-like [Andrographis paniculata]
MADQILQTSPLEDTQTPPPQQLDEQPLASVALDLQKDSPSPPPTEPSQPAKEKLKEAVTVVQKDAPLEPPPAEPATTPRSSSQPLVAPPAVIDPETEKSVDKKKGPESFASFKEESNKIADLSRSELKALEEFRIYVREAVNKGQFNAVTPSGSATNLPEEVSIWGVPLLKDDRTDVVLLKFLRARDFNVKESFAMLKNTLIWRSKFNVDELHKEDLGDDLEKVVFMQGQDKEGHPVCYNVYGEFQNKDLYEKTFLDEEKRLKFLRWRIQFLEKNIRQLDFSPGGINTIFQVSDIKNSPGPGKRELRIATRQALQILQDNYPEFVAKQVFINVPWWYLAFYTMISPFLTQRTKSKFVFAGPTRTAETLFKYISPEHVPTQYGGLGVDSCECNPEFSVDDPVTEITIKPATKQTVEIIVNEKCSLVWEVRVVGWEVRYGAEYVPNVEGGYTVIIEKRRKMVPTDEPVVRTSFNVTELGKILLTIDNPTSKKKKLLYRFKVMPLPLPLVD